MFLVPAYFFSLMGIKKGGFSPLQPKTTNLNEP